MDKPRALLAIGACTVLAGLGLAFSFIYLPIGLGTWAFNYGGLIFLLGLVLVGLGKYPKPPPLVQFELKGPVAWIPGSPFLQNLKWMAAGTITALGVSLVGLSFDPLFAHGALAGVLWVTLVVAVVSLFTMFFVWSNTTRGVAVCKEGVSTLRGSTRMDVPWSNLKEVRKTASPRLVLFELRKPVKYRTYEVSSFLTTPLQAKAICDFPGHTVHVSPEVAPLLGHSSSPTD